MAFSDLIWEDMAAGPESQRFPVQYAEELRNQSQIGEHADRVLRMDLKFKFGIILFSM